MSLLTIALCMLFSVTPAQAAQDPLDAKALLDRVDDLFRGASSHGRMTMKITTAHWHRELTVEFWSEGKEKSLMRILAPKKERNTKTLKVGRNIWNYLPKVKRIIKLPSSMMAASWMGSHFTNDDLVKESRMADDYTFEVSRRWEENDNQLAEITLLPKPEAAVVWGKVVLTIRLNGFMPKRILYYDEDFELVRTMTFSNYRKLGGRLLPAVSRIVPADKPDEITEIHYKEMAFDMPLKSDIFSLRELQR